MSDLDWPEGYERTDPSDREPCPNGFRVSRTEAFKNILSELDMWDGVTDVQLDSGAEHTKQDPNRPYADATFDDPGVVVRFNKRGEDMAAVCDRWDNPRDNAQDLYYTLHKSRMDEQRGTVTAKSEYDKYRLPSGEEDATAATPPAHAVLGVERGASDAEVKAAYRERIKEVHPDNGGTQEQFERVQNAKEALLDE
jgi:hypothetical protein